MGILVHNTMIGIERIPDDTPLFKLTVGEFKDLCNSLIPKPKEEENDEIVSIKDFLEKDTSLDKLANLSYYYVMKYSDDNNLNFDKEGVKEGLSSKIWLTRSAFNLVAVAISSTVLFSPFKVKTWLY